MVDKQASELLSTQENLQQAKKDIYKLESQLERESSSFRMNESELSESFRAEKRANLLVRSFFFSLRL